ncbi:phosphatase PAP2 family protein [Rhizobacter sp. P5_C2]
MDNFHLFELINAPAGLHPTRLMLALFIARWLVWLLPPAVAMVWLCSERSTRRELLHLLVAAACAVVIAELVRYAWPHPRPSALRLGHHYLAHAGDSGLPSDQVTVVWALALAALWTHRLSVLSFPLLAAGLVLGLARVYVGVNFPYDVLAALPVSLGGALLAWGLRRVLAPIVTRMIEAYDRCAHHLRARFRAVPPT